MGDVAIAVVVTPEEPQNKPRFTVRLDCRMVSCVETREISLHLTGCVLNVAVNFKQELFLKIGRKIYTCYVAVKIGFITCFFFYEQISICYTYTQTYIKLRI